MNDERQQAEDLVYDAMAMMADGDFSGAESILRDALGLDPYNIEALWNIGVAVQEQERNDEALEFFRRGVDVGPRSVHLLILYGSALVLSNQDEEAARVLESALETDPENSDAWSVYSTVLSSLGRDDEAAAAERRADELDRAQKEDLKKRGFVV